MGRLPPGSTLPEATIEARHVLRAPAPVVLVDRQDEAWIRPSETESTCCYRAESGAMSADVDATIVFIPECSPAVDAPASPSSPRRSSDVGGGTIASRVAVGKCLERGCDRARQRAGFAACSVGLAAFGGLSGRRGGDLVLVELEEVVGRCC
jgi:hypothetical protein